MEAAYREAKIHWATANLVTIVIISDIGFFLIHLWYSVFCISAEPRDGGAGCGKCKTRSHHLSFSFIKHMKKNKDDKREYW